MHEIFYSKNQTRGTQDMEVTNSIHVLDFDHWLTAMTLRQVVCETFCLHIVSISMRWTCLQNIFRIGPGE